MSDLQFETAEYIGGAATCGSCHQPVRGAHWMAGATTVCAACHDRLEASLGASPGMSRLGLAAVYGFGAALAGSAVWYGIREATSTEFGLLAIGVAYAVAWAIRQAAGGGLPQQILAVALTYLSIVMSYIPTIYAELAEDGGGVATGVAAVVAAIAYPIFAGLGGDFLWFIIVGIALWSAFRRSGRPRIAWTGPFQAAPAV
jgi:hypothetical protein